jgi:lysozyme family protein
MNNQKIITYILKHEGGDKFTDHPSDRGGRTKWGITERAYGGDVRNITEAQAREFYEREYILRPKFDRIEDDLLRYLVVDAGVNHGVRLAAKWLQRAAGAVEDGVVGPKTLAAVNEQDPTAIFLRVLGYRFVLWADLVRRDRSQAAFIAGWQRRGVHFLELLAERCASRR